VSASGLLWREPGRLALAVEPALVRVGTSQGAPNSLRQIILAQLPSLFLPEAINRVTSRAGGIPGLGMPSPPREWYQRPDRDGK
jgi:hypothetical protein